MMRSLVTIALAGCVHGAPPDAAPPVPPLATPAPVAVPVPADARRQAVSVRSEAAIDATWAGYADWVEATRLAIDARWERELEQTPLWRDLPPATHTTTVAVTVDGAGALQRIEVLRSSGSTSLDEAVVRAARAASPLPAPPAELTATEPAPTLPPLTFTIEAGPR